MLIFIMVSPGTTGTEEPPGITAFNFLPRQTPPAIASRSLNGMPSGTSKLPPVSTWPDTENTTVPPELGGPKLANQAAPLRRIVGTEAKLCVLLAVVGAP